MSLIHHELTAEASMLGFKAGQWPIQFKHLNATWVKDRTIVSEGEIIAVIYLCNDPIVGGRLKVFND